MLPRLRRGAFSRRAKPETSLLLGLNRLVGYDQGALEEKILNIAQAQLKGDMPAHGATSNSGCEAMTVAERFQFLRYAIRVTDRTAWKMPYEHRNVYSPLGQIIVDCNRSGTERFWA